MTVVLTPPLPQLSRAAPQHEPRRFGVEFHLDGAWIGVFDGVFDSHAAAADRAGELRTEFPKVRFRIRPA